MRPCLLSLLVFCLWKSISLTNLTVALICTKVTDIVNYDCLNIFFLEKYLMKSFVICICVDIYFKIWVSFLDI